MRFLVDAQLPPALARRLVAQGHEAEHVGDCGLAAASDAAIWTYASSVNAVIVTKDEDFAQRKVVEGDGGPKVVWVRLLNTRRQALLAWFDQAMPRLIEALERGESLIELV